MVLSFIGADPVEYEVIFTSGATAAIKLVGDALAWGSNHDNRDRSGHKTLLAYAKNSHTSVLGLRDLFSRAFCIDGDLTSPGAELVEVTADRYERRLTEPADDGSSHIGLIVTPGECNFSGAKLDLVQTAQQVHLLGQRLLKVGPRSRCLWMLDIAKLASTSRIDISTQISDPLLRPDFMCLSFYKIFGYPTGLGALIVKRSVAPLMRRR
jgi:molybdenum cofactor sulfurtransferase